LGTDGIIRVNIIVPFPSGLEGIGNSLSPFLSLSFFDLEFRVGNRVLQSLFIQQSLLDRLDLELVRLRPIPAPPLTRFLHKTVLACIVDPIRILVRIGDLFGPGFVAERARVHSSFFSPIEIIIIELEP